MSVTDNSLALIKLAQSEPIDITKTFVSPVTPTTGIQTYNLYPSILEFTPVLTPFRNSIPRVTAGFATQANWKSITDMNAGNMRAGVSQGNRGGAITHTLLENFAAYRGYGLENWVLYEADFAAKEFADVKALAVKQLLMATLVQEERLILGGNTTLTMGVTPTPTLTGSATGGTLAAGTLSVICVALSLQAYLDVTGVNNGSTGGMFNAATSKVPGQITKVNTDGSVDTFGGGSGQQSVSATVVLAGSTSSVTVALPNVVNGAVGYAWYVGAVGSEALNGVTSLASYVIKAPSPGIAQLAASLGGVDNSTSNLDFDGLLTQAFKPGSNAYVNVMPMGVAGVGTPLTPDNAGGIVEFENAFLQFYNRYRLSPTKIYVSSQELVNIARKVIAGNGSPLLALTDPVGSANAITAGRKLGNYMNKVTGDLIPVVVHPNMPAGTVFFFTDVLPYPLANTPNVVQMNMRRDYYQIEWPIRSRKYEYGVYADGVLQHFAPFSMGVITNIGNG